MYYSIDSSKVGYKHKTVPVVKYEKKPVQRTHYETRYKTEQIPVTKTEYVPVQKTSYKTVER